jgi:hypothetical protein
MRGGHPSSVTPTPPPWDSPQVEMRKSLPYVEPEDIWREEARWVELVEGAKAVAGEASMARRASEYFMVALLWGQR